MFFSTILPLLSYTEIVEMLLPEAFYVAKLHQSAFAQRTRLEELMTLHQTL